MEQSKKEIELSKPQFDFITTQALFPAFVGGYGSGKSHAAIHRVITKKFENPLQNVAYYLPSYDLVTLIAMPRFVEVLTDLGVPHILNKSEKVITIGNGSQIVMRTMDNPEKIIGYEVADSVCDELDTLPIDKAADVWRKVVGRNRQKKANGNPNTIGVATTPEGFKFVYENWKRVPFAGSELIKASTYSNAHNLPEGYIDSLKATYPAAMLAAYLDGEFVNLTQGSVYAEFDRELNGTRESIKDKETLHIGMDFNVGKMAAVVHVLRDNNPHAVDELVNYMDTPVMIRAIKERFPGHAVMVYPDASGASRKTVNASESDIALLRQAGFNVLANKKNPFIRDRVAAMNRMIAKDSERRYKVNTDKCPNLVECLEKQAYDKNGEPDKTSGFDHLADCAGYFISYRYPIQHGGAIQFKLGGL
jgi:phage terminase large subunit